MRTTSFSVIESILAEAGIVFEAVHEGPGADCPRCDEVMGLAA